MAVIFSADDGIHGQELWITNGTAEGTRLLEPAGIDQPSIVSQNYTIAAGYVVETPAFTAVGDKLMFLAKGDAGLGLWTTDGTDFGTTLIATMGSPDAMAWTLVESGGKWFVTVTSEGTRELWITDGTTSGTHYLTDFFNARAVYGPEGIAAVSNGKFVFTNGDAAGDVELWVTDGTEAGTHLLRNILDEDSLNWDNTTTPLGSYPRGFVNFDGKAIFSTDLPYSSLHITDGTADGTLPLVSVTEGAIMSPPALVGDAVVFVSYPRRSDVWSIWTTDGTESGTKIVRSFGAEHGVVNPSDLSAIASGLFVSVVDLNTSDGISSDAGLWFTDGTSEGTVQLVAEAFAEAAAFTKIGQSFVFVGQGGHLWRTDLTAAGTQQVSPVEVSRIWSINPFAEVGNKLLFAADDGVNGLELWITDGSTAGTYLLKDINLTGSSTPSLVANAGGLVLFTADDGVHGAELWISDGTEAGTRLVKDINAAGDSWAGGFTYINLAPDNVTLFATAVAENANAGTIVGNLIASDFDLSDTHTFTLLDSAGGRFVLDGAAVKTAEGAVFDFESETAFAITVRATDQGGKSIDKSLTINVTDVSDVAPTDVTLSATAVAENAANRTVIGTLVASDPESSDTHTFTLLDDAGGRFAVSGDKIVVADRLGIDFEQAASHTITVRATDQGGKFYDKVIAMAVSDVTGENVVGDTRDNIISAGAGIDRLSGGAGADRMSGGNGSDVYYVERTADVVIESNANLATGGHDTVLSSASYALSANVERLMLGGRAEIDGFGNALNNLISGNEAANTIDGGLGSDYLTGGAGRDTFRFSSALNGNTNKDFITDFNVADDTLQLSVGTFRGLAVGDLKASAFYAAAGAIKAYDASDRIVYNTTTGDLYYDADGVGGTSAIKFATLRGRPALSAADFDVVGIV